MKKPKQMKPQKLKNPVQSNRFKFISDDSLRLAIPVGPRFQADIPEWTSPPHSESDHGSYNELITSKWLGVRVWPIKGRSPNTGVGVIGKGRPDFCPCASPGSIECVKCHVSDKRFQVLFDLGPAFWGWRFDEMGEDVSKFWNLQQQQKFDCIVKMNPLSQGKSFLKPALECFPNKRIETIVRYYYNVYVPRRMKIQTRAGFKFVDTDDDEDGMAPFLESSRKRCGSDMDAPRSCKYVKNKYLTGRR